MPPALLVSAVLQVLVPLLVLFGLHRLVLLWHFRRLPSEVVPAAPRTGPHRTICVQLPLFNERAVARRLLRSVGALRWPSEQLEIQVLDDSTDETCATVDAEAAALAARGLSVRVLRRAQRTGFKAGALAAGLRVTDADLVCIFDADFVPPPSFLEDLAHHFDDPEVGMVQARWGHLNRSEGPLTRAQATLLDGHFVIEHRVRQACGLFFNFNGTAGIWRRRTIEQAGGWQADTLTEDLDLSYRAQLAGWRFAYASEIVAPAELPSDLPAVCVQQRRWAKGSVQVARKLLLRILRADLPLRVKAEALMHFGGNAGYPLVLALAVILPLLQMHPAGPQAPGADGSVPVLVSGWVGPGLLFAVASLGVLLFYEAGQRALGRPLLARLFDSVAAVALGIGLSLAQTLAILDGLGSEGGEFVRTPKHGRLTGPRYRTAAARLAGVELLLAGWLGWGLIAAARADRFAALPLLLLFCGGFAWVGGSTLLHALRVRRSGVRVQRTPERGPEPFPSGPGFS